MEVDSLEAVGGKHDAFHSVAYAVKMSLHLYECLYLHRICFIWSSFLMPFHIFTVSNDDHLKKI